MDPISLSGAYQSVKAVKDILTSLFDAKVESESKPKILEAQAKLGEIQDSLFLLRERLAELQQERDQLRQDLVGAKDWQSKENLYVLSSTSGGAVVYKFKGQPEHYACPSCFNKREIHILQDNRVLAGTFRCTGCESNYPIKNKNFG